MGQWEDCTRKIVICPGFSLEMASALGFLIDGRKKMIAEALHSNLVKPTRYGAVVPEARTLTTFQRLTSSART